MKKLALLFLTLALSAVAVADGGPIPLCLPSTKKCSLPVAPKKDGSDPMPICRQNVKRCM